MAKQLDILIDVFGNEWKVEEIEDVFTGTGETYVYLSCNGIMCTMPIAKASFKTTYNNAFFNTLRQKIANV